MLKATKLKGELQQKRFTKIQNIICEIFNAGYMV